MGMGLSMKREISSISSSCPNKALGSGGGDSPRLLGKKFQMADPSVGEISNLTRI